MVVTRSTTAQHQRCQQDAVNPLYPPTTATFFSREYFTLTLYRRRRRAVGLREIGTQHTLLDILLCACLGVPGLVYAATATADPPWLTVCVAIEFIITSVVSVLADGMMLTMTADSSNRDGIIYLDRITSAVHVICLVILFVYRSANGFVSLTRLAVATAIGIASLSLFHRRLYFIFVEQQWRPARTYARLWHVGGTIAPLVALSPEGGWG